MNGLSNIYDAIGNYARSRNREWLDLSVQIDEMEGEIEQLHATLRQVEWVYYMSHLGQSWEYCPWCNNIKADGHTSDCQRQLALAGLEAE